MSDKTERIVIDDLDKRMDAIEGMLEFARRMLADNEYLQCAVSLQKIDKEIDFDTLYLNILDGLSSIS